MYSFIWIHPNSAKKSQETGQLRGVENVAWRSAFTGSGRKNGWGIVLTIWFSCYAKNGMGKQTVVGGFCWWGNNLIFGYCGGPQSSSRENPKIHIEKSLFTFYYKTFGVYIRNNKKYLVISENILLRTNLRKNTSVNIFQKICHWCFSKLQ